MNKNLIHDRFAKNLKNYEENAKIQKRMAERLFSFVSNKKPNKILELGCGTGFLTKIASKNLDFEIYKAIDIVENCKDYINKINTNIEFINIDIEEFLKTNTETFDLIISNASLQWLDNFEETIKRLQAQLNPNGELIFSTFGKENFREIYHIVGTTLNYFSPQEIQKMFPNSFVETEIHIMAFETPIDVLKHLQLTGVNGIESRTWTKKDLISFENAYKNLCNKRAMLTYNPIYIKIFSPGG